MTYHFTAASIAPIIGCLLTIVRSTIPLREVVSIRKEHRIGEFNPMPFAAMILNHTGWVVYAVLHTDWFIFSAETTGLLCGIWITFSLYPLSNEKMQNRLSGLVVVAGLVYCILALVTMVLKTAAPSKVTVMWSWAVSVTQVLLYAAPLSTIVQAIRDRSSASFHLGLAVMGFVSSSMWTVYGSTSKNLFILVPSLLGALLTLMALAVCGLFPRTREPQTPAQRQQSQFRNLERAVELPVR
ncbi:hypothetical protein ABBQ38_010894 [Trebouxia sp. C0009 RCD-2024]